MYVIAEEIFHKYLARNIPVLVRGLINDWPALKKFRREDLIADHGDLKVQVTFISVSY